MMGRQNNSDRPTAVHSSIALLQERFKQLERAKVMRKERELSRGEAAAERPSQPAAASAAARADQQQPKCTTFLHTELVRPSRPLTSGPPPSLLRLDRYGRPEFQALETSLSMRGFEVQSRPASYAKNWNGVGETAEDFDTSLHL